MVTNPRVGNPRVGSGGAFDGPGGGFGGPRGGSGGPRGGSGGPGGGFLLNGPSNGGKRFKHIGKYSKN